MQKSKIDNDELFRLLKQRKSVSEIAAFFGVQPPAVSKRAKKLNIAIAKDITLRSAPDIVDSELRAMDQVIEQIEHSSRIVNGELHHIQEEIQGKIGAERRPAQDAILKHVAEIRKQVALLFEMRTTWNDQREQIKIFQRNILDFADSLEPGLSDRFDKGLAEQKLIYSPVCLPGGISRVKGNGI
jgi:DNA-binding Lrp family transcriptional regulator